MQSITSDLEALAGLFDKAPLKSKKHAELSISLGTARLRAPGNSDSEIDLVGSQGLEGMKVDTHCVIHVLSHEF